MAVTAKVAVLPAVTIWLTGCAVIEGATEADFSEMEASPAHPVFTMASAKTNRTQPERFMDLSALSQSFLQRMAWQGEDEQLAREDLFEPVQARNPALPNSLILNAQAYYWSQGQKFGLCAARVTPKLSNGGQGKTGQRRGAWAQSSTPAYNEQGIQ